MKIRVIEPDGFPADVIARLGEMGEVLLGEPIGSPELGVAAVFVRLARRIDAAFHAHFPDLRWVVSPTTGLDRIDVDYFAAHGIDVLSLRGRTDFLDTIHATAEHTLALALALLRDIPGAAKAVRGGAWDRYPHKGGELHGRTVLILGHGRIGRQVAGLYAAFGCRVLAHDTVEGRVPAALRCSWPDALGEADILSVHLPLEDATVGVVDAAVLARLPDRAIVVNTARGELIDQDALLGAIEQDRLAGAALDVLAGEPEPLDPVLLQRIAALGRRLVVTPHIAGFTHESLATVERFAANLLLEAIDARS